jgi:mannosyltransferase
VDGDDPVLSTERGTRAASGAALAALLVVAATLGTRAMGAGYWIDEGLTVGLAGHPASEIPGLLRQDGSPPLYYLLLSGWMSLFGSAEAATRALSLLAALAAVPAALWAGRELFGSRAGWAAAAIAATAPPLALFAQETRMYALLALLSLLVTATFVLAFVHGRRRALLAFVALAAVLVYTHNWGLYLVAGLACSLPVAAGARGARAVGRDAALAAAAVAAAYAPWVPTLLEQAERTGAPWSTTPDLGDLLKPAAVPLGEGLVAALVLAVAAIGVLRRARADEAARRAAAAIAIALAAAGTGAWIVAQLEPGWADRYMTAFAGPVILLAGAGLAAAGRAGAALLAAAAIAWALQAPSGEKSNVRDVARALPVRAGDLVVVTHPEQIAALHRYAPDGLRWATALGRVEDPTVFDWRDAPARLRRAEPRAVLAALLEPGPGVEPGAAEKPRPRRGGERSAAGPPLRLVLVGPRDMRRGGPEWLDLVARRSAQWRAAADRHPRLRLLRVLPGRHAGGTDVAAVTYELRQP